MVLPSTQKQLQQIDEEVTYLKSKGNSGVKLYLNWLEMKKGICQQSNGDSFFVTNQFEGEDYLYEVLRRRFEDWQSWKKNGKKVSDISNFGIKNEPDANEKQEDKEVAKTRVDIQEDFDEYISQAFGGKN